MLDYLIGLAVLVVVIAIPKLRRAALSVLALSAIAAVAIGGIALPVWGLYRANPWLTAPAVVVGEEPVAGPEQASVRPGEAPAESTSSPEKDDDRQRLEEAQKRAAEEQLRIDEELQRVAQITEEARSAVENDRKYAEIAASSPRIPGLERVSTDLIAIRIPSWRDQDLAEREKGLIRAWLVSIGLTAEETASIYTARGWGSVYDLWRRETTTHRGSATEDPASPNGLTSEGPSRGQPPQSGSSAPRPRPPSE